MRKILITSHDNTVSHDFPKDHGVFSLIHLSTWFYEFKLYDEEWQGQNLVIHNLSLFCLSSVVLILLSFSTTF